MTTTPIAKLSLDEIASAVMLLKHRCMQLGLFKTMHALEGATKAVGWELAEQIEAKQSLAKKDAAYRRRWHETGTMPKHP
jgi:hypothetical protein